MLAPIAQTGTAPTRERLVGSHVKMLDPPPAPAHKKLLPVAAKVARLPHHVEHLRFIVDDNADRRLAREGREGRGGYPPEVIDADARGSFDEGARFVGLSAEAEGCGGHGGNLFTTGPEGLSSRSGEIFRVLRAGKEREGSSEERTRNISWGEQRTYAGVVLCV